MNIREMLERRAALIAQARAILEAAEAASRDLTAEEQAQWDRLLNEADEVRQRVEREERQQALEVELETAHAGAGRTDTEGRRAGPAGYEFRSRGLVALNERDPAWVEHPDWQRRMALSSPEHWAAFRAWLAGGIVTPEVRALQADSDTLGGYLVTPIQFVDRLIQAVDDVVYIRQWATVIAVPTAASLGAPSLDTDPADADWTTELATGSEDSSMAFGQRQLHPHPLAKRIKMSSKLLRMVPDSEGLVRARLAYKFAITWEKAALTGSGSNQPLGVFTASGDGISTSRDVSTGNTTTAIQFDGLIEAKYTLKTQYWPRARWLFHRDAMKQIAKLKDGQGQYLWRESVRAGEPDRVLGLPAFMSEYAPNTFTTGLYVGILGDFSNYWIADAMDMSLQRLVELYAESNQVGLIGRLESDGMPVLEEAFVRVQLA